MSAFKDQFEIFGELGVEKADLAKFRKLAMDIETLLDNSKSVPAQQLLEFKGYFRNVTELEQRDKIGKHIDEIEKYSLQAYERFKVEPDYMKFHGISIQNGSDNTLETLSYYRNVNKKVKPPSGSTEIKYSLEKLINHMVVSYFLRKRKTDRFDKSIIIRFLYDEAAKYESIHIGASYKRRLSPYAKGVITGYLTLVLGGADQSKELSKEKYVRTPPFYDYVKYALAERIKKEQAAIAEENIA
ncbi:hypothetical protein CJD36_022525 [Flavipsychrobacter stenotrophus]|uniref:Uncharacterized protein n=1 Tax=Flavipsychrobacter stenotrophus TaxID=2077091 RepID=A0A2S7SQE1_9BACT|nr:hypothetical protein [Flavipsychrobacter stenotrophus]PQJ08776.1 hypothetical protein CJD36_022525 [Flavipsychrobacter stenotrophus]